MVKYSLDWPDNANPVKIEMEFIKSGGHLTIEGKKYGNGLSFHYEEMRKLLWPRLDDHRWHRLCRDEILKNKVTVLMGCASSGKTHEAAWLYLTEYFCFPDETCVLVSSTDIRGLRLRIWGEISMLWQEAINEFPFLPGHLLDSRIAITTDEMPDADYSDRRVRDMRKGIIGIPTVQGGKWVGLGKWCFPAGSPVDTPNGPKPIEKIRSGEIILSAFGPAKVSNTISRYATHLVRIHLTDGRSFDCTPEHPILTQSGWVNASCLLPQHIVYSPHETMLCLREGLGVVPRSEEILLKEMSEKHLGKEVCMVFKTIHPFRGKSDFLFSILRSEMENVPAGYCPENDFWKESEGGWESNQSGNSIQQEGNDTKEEVGIHLGEKIWRMEKVPLPDSNQVRKNSPSPFPSGHAQPKNTNREKFKEGIFTLLPIGFGLAPYSISRRNRWKLSRTTGTKKKGFREGQVPSGTRVDGVEILEPSGDSINSTGCLRYKVYDLEIDGHPSFSINGVVVHNCGIKQKRLRLIADESQAMSSNFLSAFSNLNKNEDFRAIIIGNPNDPLDPLGKAAEPLDGWSGHLEPKKTEVWKTRFMGGTCVNLIGTDSPNFDFPADKPARYKYLISQQKINDTLSFFAKDSFEYYSQCIGCMKVGTLDDRIITRELCRNFGALDPAIWKGSETIKVCALDAAYGGDRAVCGHVEFGEDVKGHVIIEFRMPQIVPVIVNSATSPEEQLAVWVRDYCERNEIPPANFFHDSTGRGGLGTAIARAWSSECNPVEFGGSASDRPVSLDLLTYDVETQSKRLAKCNEHYDRLVSELWYQLRYAIESGQLRGLPEEVMDELCMRKWERVHRNNKITIETKQKMKERIGRSPDLGDWAALCLEGSRRLGFMIEKFKGVEEMGNNSKDYLEIELAKYRHSLKSRQLHYT